jgi:hypothetical protein
VSFNRSKLWKYDLKLIMTEFFFYYFSINEVIFLAFAGIDAKLAYQQSYNKKSF